MTAANNTNGSPMAEPPPRSLLLRAAKKIGVTGAASIALVVLGLCYRNGVPAFGETWDLVKTLLVFVFMVTLLRHKVEVGVVLILSSAVLGALFALPAVGIARAMSFDVLGRDAALHMLLFKAVRLIFIIVMINGLGRLLEAAGTMRRLIGALGDLISDGRYVMAAIPAAIGLLPMPGGAMLSAPFVGELGDRMEVGPENKTLVNYWFRHIFEYAWPLYPAVLIAAEQTGRALDVVVKAHAPMVLASALVGLVFLHLRVERRSLNVGHKSTVFANMLTILQAAWPVAVVALAVGLAPKLNPSDGEGVVLRVWDLAIPASEWVFPGALVVVNVAVALLARLSWAQMREVAGSSFKGQTVVLVLGIYMLRGMFDKTDVTGNMPGLLASIGVPSVIVIFVVPFIVGLLTGYNVAAVSTSFPALVALLPTGGHVLIAYCGAFFGVLLSPVHLCLILTKDYFKAHLGHVYRVIVPMLAAMACIMAAYSMLLET